jgi:hypothetical protein
VISGQGGSFGGQRCLAWLAYLLRKGLMGRFVKDSRSRPAIFFRTLYEVRWKVRAWHESLLLFAEA